MKPSRTSAGRAAYYEKKNPPISIKADMSAFDALLDEMVDGVQDALRPAVQAGAEVLYRAVLRNVDAIGSVTGNLKRAIYQAYATKVSAPDTPTYQISWRTRQGAGPTAPHGHMLEHGWIQRYAVHTDKNGHWHTVVKPENRGKKAPWVGTGKRGGNRKASQAEMDAWYVLRPGGPVQHPGKKFIASAQSQFPAAQDAAIKKLWDILGYAGA